MRKTLLAILTCAASVTLAAQETTYFTEDFEWLEPWTSQKPAGQTVETDDPDATAQQLGTNKVNEISTYQALLNKGYEFLAVHAPSKSERQPNAQIYLQRNYLKFGLTGYQSGITLPPFSTIPDGAKVTISFDWCSQRHGDGTWDATDLVVVVKNGEKETILPVPEHRWAENEKYSWVNTSVDLSNVTVNNQTKISIRNADNQWPSGSALRWFLDNIKLFEKNSSGIDGVVVEEQAPVEYYNLQGIRVAEPTNGLYIRRQGNKATKVIL